MVILFLTVLLSTFVTEHTVAQENNSNKLGNIAVINIEAIRRDSGAVKNIRGQIDKFREKFQAEIKKEEEPLFKKRVDSWVKTFRQRSRHAA